MGITINKRVNVGMTFIPGQTFVFGNIALLDGSAGNLGQVKIVAPGQIIRFVDLEYITNSRGGLVPVNWVSNTSRVSEKIKCARYRKNDGYWSGKKLSRYAWFN